MISVKNLDKYYSKGRSNEVHVINGITAELPDRGITAIFGRSGCGKTTFLNVIGGLDRFNGGEVLIGGESVKNNTDDIRNRNIGYIFQNYNLNKLESVYENVADALRLCGIRDESVIGERVNAALSMVGMEKYIRRTPDTLSGGQQQRVAIARAIVKSPKIILADEPTGNLDEENTVMVMDLLHKIAEDRLVVLVTHEQNLVDYYCDTVIELSDGKIVDVRQNGMTGGYSRKSKNDIYLGEFEKKNTVSDVIDAEYYGELPQTPIKLHVVNNNGHFYIRIDTPGIHVLDETSEVKLREGVYTEEKREGINSNIDMSKLSAVTCGKTGRLFTLRSSLKSGFRANFRAGGKGKKALLAVMAVFSVVMVLMTATFGATVNRILDVDKSYNHNTYYVYLPDAKTYETLKNAQNAGISYMYQTVENFYGDVYAHITASCFESAAASYYYSDVETHGVILPWSQLDGYGLLAGRKDGLCENEFVISSAAADVLLENVAYSYIDGYTDLPGLNSHMRIPGLQSGSRIAGVVKSDEPLLFVSDNVVEGLANSGDNILRASDYGFEQPSDGECILLAERYGDEHGLFEGEDNILIRGRTYRIAGRTDNDTLSQYYMKLQESAGKSSAIKVIDYRYFDCAVFVNDREYGLLAESFGQTTEQFAAYGQKIWVVNDSDKENGFSYDMLDSRFAVVHSSDPGLTDSFLRENLPELYSDESFTGVVGPDILRMDALSGIYSDMLSQIIVFAVFTAVMCLCMYFIMRSSLLSRVKEVGIYRAIGVCRRNIVFRFLLESAVVTTLTVFVTYLLSSGAVFWLASMSSSRSIVYYPLWLALLLLVFQYAVCMLFGTIPVISLLRRSPSEILAKYDI